ncbi:hypothetical protein [Actinocrispum sp. NPDC049592]|uniref:hypothetical protein n=1 Tax=Actinocrispum sp. NPDC049592 TaxID=3154835 RepID=UPI00342328B8
MTEGPDMDIRTWHKPLLLLTGLMLASLLFGIGGLAFDDRVLLGEPIWLKPVKFSVSIAIYAFTLAWLMSLLRKRSRLVWWMGTVISATMVVEMVVIIGQATRGTRSHFNNLTDFDSQLYQIMGMSIVVAWLANLVIGIAVLRQRFAAPATLWAIRLGLLIALGGMAVAFFMTAPTESQLAIETSGGHSPSIGAHTVGVPDGGPGMPITHWSTVGGDLRVPHFIGIHALQALPLLALLLRRRFSRWDEVVRTRLVLAAGAGYFGLLVLTTWQALRGQSLIAPDGLTMSVFALLVLAVAGSAVAIVRSRPRAAVESPEKVLV